METQVLTSVITATSFRVSFFGGGTDFPGYFNQRSGIVVASAIRKYSYIAVNYLERLLENDSGSRTLNWRPPMSSRRSDTISRGRYSPNTRR